MKTIKQIKTVVDRWDGAKWNEVTLYRNSITGMYVESPHLCEGQELLECRIDAAAALYAPEVFAMVDAAAVAKKN